ncbi:MAG: hypothetical protein M3014_08710 [Chloroflexota bacterium]|nr:hypothetical protein [Chloroflexota bacterium]
MQKGINLQAKIAAGTDSSSAAGVRQALPGAFAQANPGMTLAVKEVSPPDAAGHMTLKVYIQGDQDPASNFSTLAHTALNKAVAALNTSTGAASTGGGPRQATQAAVTVHSVQEVENDDENSGVVLPPRQVHAPGSTTSSKPAAAQRQQQGPVSAPDAVVTDRTPSSAQPKAQPTAHGTSVVKTPWWAVWRKKG